MKYLVLLCVLPLGCALLECRKQAIEWSLAQSKDGRTNIEAAGESLRGIIKEIEDARVQERVPVLAMLVNEAGHSLQNAATNMDEVGLTLTVLNEDLGPSATGGPSSRAAAALLRVKHQALAKKWKMIQGVVRGFLKLPKANSAPPPEPWSGTDIASLVTALSLAAGTLGIGGKKVYSGAKRRAAEKD